MENDPISSGRYYNLVNFRLHGTLQNFGSTKDDSTDHNDTSPIDDVLGEETFRKNSNSSRFLSKRDSYDTFAVLEQKVDTLNEEQFKNLLENQTEKEASVDDVDDRLNASEKETNETPNVNLEEKRELTPTDFRNVLKNKIKPPEQTVKPPNTKQNDMRGNLKPTATDEAIDSLIPEPASTETKNFREALSTHIPQNKIKKPNTTTVSTTKETLKNNVPMRVEGNEKFESKKLDFRQKLQPVTSSVEATKQIAKMEEKLEKPPQLQKTLNPVRKKSALGEHKASQNTDVLLEARVGLKRAPIASAENKDTKSKIPQIPRRRSQQN